MLKTKSGTVPVMVLVSTSILSTEIKVVYQFELACFATMI